jgi:ATP-binding cassette subfamily B protein
MDSWAEAEWFDRLRGLAEGRTGIIITHRFTIAMRADLILVLDEGRVVESGTHDELLAINGLYARSWSSQMLASLHKVSRVRPSTLEDITVQRIQ